MKHTREISVFLIISLLLALTACGGSAQGDDTGTGSFDDTTTELVETSEYEKPDVDYGGKTVTVAAHNRTGSFVIADYNPICHDELSGDIIANGIINTTRAVEEALGVTLEYFNLEDGNASAIMRDYQAGDNNFQLALVPTSALAQLLSTPYMLTDLNAVGTINLSHSWWDQKSVEEYTINDRIYCVTGDISLTRMAAAVCVFFNKKLIDVHNLEDPYELVRRGEWTIDKMIELACAAAVDNGNQNIDLEDTFGMIGESGSMTNFLVSGGVDYSRKNNDGEVEITYFSDRAVNIVEKIVPFLTDANISMHPSYWGSYAKTEVFADVLNPKFINNGALFYSNHVYLALDFRGMEADFGILPMPKYDVDQSEYITPVSRPWCDNLVIPSTNTEFDMIGHVAEAMGYYSQKYTTPALIETSIYGKSLRDENSAEMLNIISDTMYYDIAMLFNWGGISGLNYSLVDSKNTNLSSLYASYDSIIKQSMEKTMKILLLPN